MNSTSDLETPAIPWREVWPELIAVVVAVLIPPLLLVFDLAERQADLFQRGGLISLFIVVVLQFKALSDLNRKHVLNAVRAKRGELVLGISPTRTNLGWLTLLVAIYASTVAAFGDKFVDALLRVFYAQRSYLQGGRLPVDNNHIENLMRPWAMGRKAQLFCGSELAGQRAAAVMSLVMSAKLNGHDPWAYLKDVLTRLPTHMNSRIDELLPHRWQPPR